MHAILPVILSGGAGARLRPLSRDACPRRLVPLVGNGTMRQATSKRVADIATRPPLVVADQDKPGAAPSLQMHHRAEHWIVVSGTAKVTRGEETLRLTENRSTCIPLGVVHRLENPGKVPLEPIEVPSGGCLGEDAIVRLDDVYGRAA